VNPFLFEGGKELLRKADRYFAEVLASRGRPESAGYPRLTKEERAGLAAIVAQRTGHHRLAPLGEGDRRRAFRSALAEAGIGGRASRRRASPGFCSRVIVVFDDRVGGEPCLTSEDLAEIDRLTSGKRLLPATEVLLVPASILAEAGAGAGVESYRRSLGFPLEGEATLAGYPTRFDAQVALRALEERLTRAIFARYLVPGGKARTAGEGLLRVGGWNRRYVYPLPAGNGRPTPTRGEAFDPFGPRLPDLLGVPRPCDDPFYTTAVHLEAHSESSRRYRVEMDVRESRPVGPLVGALPEHLTHPGCRVTLRYRAPGEAPFRTVGAMLAGSRFVPEGLGYGFEADDARGPVLAATRVPAGRHTFVVTVEGPGP